MRTSKAFPQKGKWLVIDEREGQKDEKNPSIMSTVNKETWKTEGKT